VVNETARHVVERYLNMEVPKYALLVDAPWGCGKTHFIKEVTNCETVQSRLYLSLYGVHTAEQFEWALVRAMNPWAEGGFGNFAARVKEFMSSVTVAGCSVDLNKINTTEIALNDLPNILIFDDVERCGLKVKQLMGLINRYVEHEGRRVILVANSDKHKELPDFLKTREKLVGQVVSIRADVDAAIVNALTKMPEGQGRTFLTEHQSVVKEIFEEADHQNLRLLMRAMRDAADLIDQIEPGMVAFVEPMLGLLRTFLALHMAYHGGKITKEDVGRRTEIMMQHVARSVNAESQHPDYDPEKQSFDGVLLDTEVLGDELATQLFVEGYATYDQINTALQNTHRFAEPAQLPDSVKLWNWPQLTADQFQNVKETIDGRMGRYEIVDPMEILSIYGAFTSRGEQISNFDREHYGKRFVEYAKAIVKSGKLAGSADLNESGFGVSENNNMCAIGGRQFLLDELGHELVLFIEESVDAAYGERLKKVADELFRLLQTGPKTFITSFKEYSRYNKHDVLCQINVAEAAIALMDILKRDPMMAADVAYVITKHVRFHTGEGQEDQRWLAELTVDLLKLAKEEGCQIEAQVNILVDYEMRLS